MLLAGRSLVSVLSANLCPRPSNSSDRRSERCLTTSSIVQLDQSPGVGGESQVEGAVPVIVAVLLVAGMLVEAAGCFGMASHRLRRVLPVDSPLELVSIGFLIWLAGVVVLLARMAAAFAMPGMGQ
jgi:hypothetical protein